MPKWKEYTNEWLTYSDEIRTAIVVYLDNNTWEVDCQEWDSETELWREIKVVFRSTLSESKEFAEDFVNRTREKKVDKLECVCLYFYGKHQYDCPNRGK